MRTIFHISKETQENKFQNLDTVFEHFHLFSIYILKYYVYSSEYKSLEIRKQNLNLMKLDLKFFIN